MTRALLTAALLLTACKGEPARPSAESVTVASTDAALTDASTRMSDADFDKLMHETITVVEEILPIVSQSKDCGAVAGAAATALGNHSDLFVEIQGMPDFEARAKVWLGGHPNQGNDEHPR